MYNNYNPYFGAQQFNQPQYSRQPQQMPQIQPTVQNVQPAMPEQNYIQYQPVSQIRPSIIQGKIVDSIDVVKVQEIPLDGSLSVFPLADNSAIVTKQLGIDGISKMTVFKPVKEEEEPKKETVKYATFEDIDKAISNIDLSGLEDLIELKEDIRDIKKQLKEIKKKE